MSAPLGPGLAPAAGALRRRGSSALAKAAKPSRPSASARVWTGARKRIAVNPLQMSLPGLDQPL